MGIDLPSDFREAIRLREFNLNPAFKKIQNLKVNDVILLDLFYNKNYQAVISDITIDVNGTQLITAKINGLEFSYCFISTYNDISFITIEVLARNELYMTKYFHNSGKYYLMQIDKNKKIALEGANSLIPSADIKIKSGNSKNNNIDLNIQKNKDNFDPQNFILKNETIPEIVTLLIVYTPAAAIWSNANEGNINNTISMLMAKSNLALSNSNTFLQLQLVHSQVVNYVEAHNNNDLIYLTLNGDGVMDTVHYLRNNYCADVVVLLEQTNFTGGVGWLLNTIMGLPDYAFSLTRVQQASWTYTTVHEIAHNMGCHHHKAQNVQPGPGLYTYSAGWRWTGSDNKKYCSVMTYESGQYFADGINHARTPFISNPNITHFNANTGDSVDGDNARNIRQIKSVIANYRSGCNLNDVTWTGLDDNNWNNPNNWDQNFIPVSTSDVLIPSAPIGGVFPVLNSNVAYCNNLDIDINAELNISNLSTLYIYGNLINNGHQNLGEGTFCFSGLNQSISGLNEFGNISISDVSITEILNNEQKVNGVVLCNGTLFSNGLLTLISNANNTALIDGNGVGNIIGNVIQQRFIAANKAIGYKHFSSAFSNANLGQLSNFMTLHFGNTNNSPYPTVFKFNEANAVNYFTKGWVEAAPQGQSNTLFELGSGYTVQLGNFSGNNVIAFLYGNVNNGNYNVNLTRLNPGTGKGDGWNFLGNPYPSPIDLDKLPFNEAKINKSISIYISTSMYNGYYGYYNAALHTALNGGTRYLPALHGFFVQCNDNAGSTFTFSNSLRSNIITPDLYKDVELSSSGLTSIKLSAAINQNTDLIDETAICFVSDASEQFDSDYDASKIRNTEVNIPNIFSLQNNNELAINALPYDFSDEIIIPLGYTSEISGKHFIKANSISNFDSEIQILLKDNKNNLFHNFTNSDIYSFEYLKGEPETGRFFIYITKSLLSNTYNTNTSHFNVYSNGNEIIVFYNSNDNTKGVIELYDIQGKLVLKSNQLDLGKNIFRINSPKGFYILKFTDNYSTKSYKLFVE